MRRLLALLMLGCCSAVAGETVMVCYNYGCLSQSEVLYSEAQLRQLSALLDDAHSAARERALLGTAIGWMLGWAGQQSPISADRGGNFDDDAVYGRMDCIDHSTTTTRLLRLLDRHGLLRFHRVMNSVRRTRWLLFEHFSAQIEEKTDAENGSETKRYVVDSWFVDNGQSAVVMPLEKWLAEGDEDEP